MVSGASVVRPPGVERSVPRRWSLQTGLRLVPSAGNGLLEGFVVALLLFGVGLGELGNGLVEGGPGPEVRGDGDAVAGSGVAPGQRLGTRTGVPDQAGRDRPLDGERALPVAQLPEVVVPGDPVHALGFLPSPGGEGCRVRHGG